jgi:hypothetical protein
MAFTRPPGSELPGQSQFSLTGTYTTEPPYAYLIPFPDAEADAQIRELDERFKNKPISYSPTSSSTTTQTTSTASTTTTTAVAARMHFPEPQRSSLPRLENDPRRPMIVDNIHPPRQQVEKLPSFKAQFENSANTSNRSGLPLPSLAPLKEHQLSKQQQLELLYYDQLLGQSEYDIAFPRREELKKAILSINSSGVQSSIAFLISDYSCLLEVKLAYNLLGIDGNFIDFNKKIKEEDLSVALAYLMEAEKTMIDIKDQASNCSYKISQYSRKGDYTKDIVVQNLDHEVSIRGAIVFFLQSFCYLKKNKMATSSDDVCGVHEAYPLYQKSRMSISHLSTVNDMVTQMALAQMNSNLAMLCYEISRRTHADTCYEYMRKITSSSASTTSTLL